MTSPAKSKAVSSAGHMQRFVQKLRQLKQVVANLPGDDFHKQLLITAHRPGWTTTAERLLFESILNSILAQTQIAQPHHRLRERCASATAKPIPEVPIE
jgi:hypothetical protein